MLLLSATTGSTGETIIDDDDYGVQVMIMCSSKAGIYETQNRTQIHIHIHTHT